jgi:hypothetical protein
MRPLRHGATSSYKFRHYCAEATTSPQEIRKVEQQKVQITTSVVDLVSAASQVAHDVLQLLDCPKTKAHLNSGKLPPKSMERKIRKVCAKLQSACVCFSKGLSDVLNDPGLHNTVDQLSKMAEDLSSLMDSVTTFHKNPQVDLAEVLRRRLRWIINHTKKVRTNLHPHTKLVAATPHKKVPRIAVPEAPTAVLFPDTPKPSISSFLQRAEERGWTVTKTMQKVLRNSGIVPLEDDPGLEESLGLLQQLQGQRSLLLSEDTKVGVSQQPIISYNTKRPPESVIQKYLTPSIGYDIYLVFGSYLIINQMCLLGIHKDLLWVLDDNDKPKLDTDKFSCLMPFATNEMPQWAALLSQTHPIQPARRAGSHYYCPLVPTSILNSWGHGLGEWDFLT